MSHDKIFIIAPPRPPEQRRNVRPPDPAYALLNMLFIAVCVHGFLLLVSWAIFLAAPLGVRLFIAVCWIVYLTIVGALVRAAYVGARKARPPS